MFNESVDVDLTIALHGRAPAAATGIKRMRPDVTVWTMQGDGDMVNEGLAEILQAAGRGERLTCFLLNNGVFGDTGGQMTIVEVTEPPGAEAPLHVHRNEDEAFWILEGDVTLEVGGNTVEAHAGDYAFGLMSAIPLLLLHAKLTSTTGQIVDSLEMASVKSLNCISDFRRRQEAKSETPGAAPDTAAARKTRPAPAPAGPACQPATPRAAVSRQATASPVPPPSGGCLARRERASGRWCR